MLALMRFCQGPPRVGPRHVFYLDLESFDYVSVVGVPAVEPCRLEQKLVGNRGQGKPESFVYIRIPERFLLTVGGVDRQPSGGLSLSQRRLGSKFSLSR